MKDSVILYLWLKMAVPNFIKAHKLIEYFGGIENVYKATEKQINEIVELNDKEKSALIDKDTLPAGKILRLCEIKDIKVIALDDPLYPNELIETGEHPLVLFAYGNYEKALSKPKIAIVGTKNCTSYAEINTANLSGALSLSGFTIVTGVAKGIDTAAINGALKVGGSVIAIIPSGHTSTLLSTSYKFKDIRKNGVILSEHFPNTPTTKFTYHQRNRLISGISIGTIVTQAPIKSGALVTANYAIDQDRDLFILTANVDMKQSEGSNILLLKGATATLGYKDIVEYYKPMLKDALNDDISNDMLDFCKKKTEDDADILYDFKRIAMEHMNTEEKLVFSIIDTVETDIDYIIQQSGLPVSEVMASLSSLEALGTIVSCPGNKYKILIRG